VLLQTNSRVINQSRKAVGECFCVQMRAMNIMIPELAIGEWQAETEGAQETPYPSGAAPGGQARYPRVPNGTYA